MPLPLLSVFSLLPAKGWLALIVTGALLGAFWYHQHEIGERDDLIAERDKRIATRDITIANQSISIGQERLNVSMLMSRISDQNAAIEAMQLKAKQSEAAANVAAVRAFTRGREEAEKLRRPDTTVPSGAPGMNVWLTERFKP